VPNLAKKVQNAVFRHSLFKRGSKIILAVSGGPDSVAMLDIFSQFEKKYSLETIIAHINYGLRGVESDKDEDFVRSLAERYGLRIRVFRPKIKTGSNLENNLRDVRYAFFEKIKKENNFDLIAVAHNLNDQVETFLMRLIRGSGLTGLSAMEFKHNSIVRPLLGVSRTEILNYLKENGLAWRLDKTNLESRFFRNKIRNKLIPYLEKEFNPKITKTLSDSIDSIAQDSAYLSDISRETFKSFFKIKVSKILKLHPAIQRRVLRTAIESKKKDLKNIGSAHIEELIKIIRSTKNKSQIAVFKGLKITRKGDRLNIENI